MFVRSLQSILDADKTRFLNDIVSSIHSYILSTGKQCIAVVRRDDHGDIIARYPVPSLTDDDMPPFVKILVKFMKQNPGLDSALTHPIMTIIKQKYVTIYVNHSNEISQNFLDIVQEDKILLNSFVERLTDKVLGKLTSRTRSKIVHLLVHQLPDATTTHAGHAVSQHVTHFASAAVGSQVATIAAHVFLKVIAANIGQSRSTSCTSPIDYFLKIPNLTKYLPYS